MSENVTIKVKLPRPFIESLRRQSWFKWYEDVEEFTREAIRLLEQSYLKTELLVRGA
jgi:Arc/MetJ-type ribon-helix-helix transcriptional regulator